MRALQGGCHCGRVRFRVMADLAGVAECNCTIWEAAMQESLPWR
jgi:hypothetical protein